MFDGNDLLSEECGRSVAVVHARGDDEDAVGLNSIGVFGVEIGEDGDFGGAIERIDGDVSAETGEKLSECKLKGLPAWDGLIAANEKLYLTMKNGSIKCFSGVKNAK